MSATQGPNVAGLIDSILERALALRASDIHFEPGADGMWVRVRVDGALTDFESLPGAVSEHVVARLKVLGSLLTYRTDVPQEGSLRWTGHGATGTGTDLRVATFPTVRGERAVVRVFRDFEALTTLESLGFPKAQADALHEAARQPSGLVVVCGPAGSGKTTTLYALVRHLRDRFPDRSIITLEDPVERLLDRVTQIQVHPYGELSYQRCLRSLLRQDPQVLLLGEIRDAETASIAIEATLTGHLILTTVHSADPAECVVRFLDMGIAPYQLVSTLALVCAQRLVRKRCRPCGAPDSATCPRCLGTGYYGRTTVAQVARLDERIRDAILAGASAPTLRSAFRTRGANLRARGDALAAEGLTDAREIERVMGPAPRTAP